MTLVFQYGSNCLDSQINGVDRLRGDARFIGIAQTVDDFRLSFDVWSNGRNCAAANIIPYPGNKVWGALYEIPDYLIDWDSANPMPLPPCWLSWSFSLVIVSAWTVPSPPPPELSPV